MNLSRGSYTRVTLRCCPASPSSLVSSYTGRSCTHQQRHLSQTSSSHISGDDVQSPSTFKTVRPLPPALLMHTSQPLKRRASRQLEQQYGPMWRYMSLISDRTPASSAEEALGDNPPVRSAANVVTRGNDQDRDDSTHLPDDSRRRLLLERAREVGLVDVVPHTASQEPSSTDAEVVPVTDPLLDFLEKNEEEAVILLAMWTSLRRSCLYASEISESLSLRVRYFFHSLIHRRAIAAAFELYHRLVYIGVQLRNNDLMLLLSNLPYEHSAAERERQEEWHKEAVQAYEESQKASLRRVKLEEEARKSAARRAAMAKKPTQPIPRQTTAQMGTTPDEQHTQGRQTSSSVAVDNAPTEKKDDWAVETHLLANQPEWVRRWVLYEASMGNLDLYGDEATADILEAEVAASHGTQVMTAAEGDVKEDDDPLAAAWDGSDTSSSEQMRTLVAESHEANRMMEMTAVLKHLYLLQVTAQVREHWLTEARSEAARFPPSNSTAPLSSSRGATRMRIAPTVKAGQRSAVLGDSAAAAAPPSRFWKEGEQLLSNFLTKNKFSKGTGTPRVSPPARGLPPQLLDVVNDIVRASRTWKAAYAFDRLVGTTPGALSHRDATLFFRLASEHSSVSLPWSRNAAMEAFVENQLVPLVLADTAAGHAVQSIWIGYLCHVKLSRPEAFLMMQKRVEGLWGLEEDVTAMADLVTLVMSKAKVASSLLLIEVTRFAKERRAEATLAASVRSGAFCDDREIAQTAALAVTASVDADRHAPRSLLSNTLMDSFVLCCAAVRGALSMAAVSAVRGNDALVALHSFVEGAVYGPFGIWTIFSRVYLDNPNVGNPKEITQAPERCQMSVVMVLTLLHVAQELCGGGREAGTQRQLRLLLELASTALGVIPAARKSSDDDAALGAVDGRDVLALKHALARLSKPLLAALALDRPDERAVFGAVGAESVHILVSYAKMVVHLEQLSEKTLHARPSVAATRRRPPANPALLSLITPRTRRTIVSVVFGGNSALGRRVRAQLSRREVAVLDTLLHTRKRRQEAGALSSGTARATLPRVAVMPFRETVDLRNEVYAAVLERRMESSSSPSSADKKLCDLLPKGMDAVCHYYGPSGGVSGALLVHNILIRYIGAARNTVSMHFFAEVLQSMAVESKEALRAGRYRQGRTVNNLRASTGSVAVVDFSSWWEDAVGVFWSAVDHTGPGRLGDAEAARQVMNSHERDAATELLIPMLTVANATDRRDAGHMWRKQWVARFTKDERRQPWWQQKQVEALAVLQDASALQRASDLYRHGSGGSAAPEVVPDSVAAITPRSSALANGETNNAQLQLLCSVALRSRKWETALTALHDAFGTPESHEAAGTAYPPTVAHAILTLLGKSRTNLANSALRLRTIQGEAWDLQGSVAVLQLLVRARRWRLALQVAHDTAAMPEVKELALRATKQQLTRAPAPLQAEVLLYANFLVLTLQACSTGGQSEDATRFYDLFQEVLVRQSGTLIDGVPLDSNGSLTDPSTPPQDGDDDQDMDALERAMMKAGSSTHTRLPVGGKSSSDTTSVSSDEGRSSLSSQLEELVPRARALYFRAVTKEMMKGHTQQV